MRNFNQSFVVDLRSQQLHPQQCVVDQKRYLIIQKQKNYEIDEELRFQHHVYSSRNFHLHFFGIVYLLVLTT